MNSWKKRVRRLFGQDSAPEQTETLQDVTVPLTPEFVKSIVESALSTNSDRPECNECFVELDVFAEMHLVGKNASEALPLVKDHLDQCENCHEEFEALLLALQAP